MEIFIKRTLKKHMREVHMNGKGRMFIQRAHILFGQRQCIDGTLMKNRKMVHLKDSIDLGIRQGWDPIG